MGENTPPCGVPVTGVLSLCEGQPRPLVSCSLRFCVVSRYVVECVSNHVLWWDDCTRLAGSDLRVVEVQRRRRELRGGGGAAQVSAAPAPALVVADAEQHHEVLHQRQEHEDGARDQPHLDALQLQRVWRVCAGI